MNAMQGGVLLNESNRKINPSIVILNDQHSLFYLLAFSHPHIELNENIGKINHFKINIFCSIVIQLLMKDFLNTPLWQWKCHQKFHQTCQKVDPHGGSCRITCHNQGVKLLWSVKWMIWALYTINNWHQVVHIMGLRVEKLHIVVTRNQEICYKHITLAILALYLWSRSRHRWNKGTYGWWLCLSRLSIIIARRCGISSNTLAL